MVESIQILYHALNMYMINKHMKFIHNFLLLPATSQSSLFFGKDTDYTSRFPLRYHKIQTGLTTSENLDKLFLTLRRGKSCLRSRDGMKAPFLFSLTFGDVALDGLC